ADGRLLTALAGGAGCVPGARADRRRRSRAGGRGPVHLLPLLMGTPTTARSPVRRAERRAAPGDSTARRPLAAGHVVIVVLVALALGTLLNARGLRESAQLREPGWQRNTTLALTRPLAWVSGATLLDRPRAAAEE